MIGVCLPYRDRKYSLFLILLFYGTGCLLGFFSLFPWLCISCVVGGSVFLLNHLFLKIPFFPSDRILSAFSLDGLHWIREPGIRLDVGGLHKSRHVYYPQVVNLETGFRIYFRAGGYDSFIGSAVSDDGLNWREEPGKRIGPEKAQGISRIEPGKVMRFAENDWRMFFGGFANGSWRIYCARSCDGFNWAEGVLCIDLSQDGDLNQVKDPCVVEDGDFFRIYYKRFSIDETEIFTGISKDGYHWRDMRKCLGYRLEGFFIGSPCVVKTSDKLLRMYFAEYPDASCIGSRIASAVSADGINWNRESGVRIEPGGKFDKHEVFGGNLVRLENGWRMYYGGAFGRHWLEGLTLLQRRRLKKGNRV